MSENIAIQLERVGKMYKMFPNRLDNFLDALNLGWLAPGRKSVAREFWAVRDVDLEVKAGSRLGIIGRNGAGKSTLLKLITQNKAPTEGTVRINGQVQALLEAGAGFHPEFTGYENIRASLIYQGLEPRNIQKAIEDIEEFTELGQFLSQPFKTYSAGMQARLTFATATTLNPDILIVDEILGAGDAYFAGKSLERMQGLVKESGATVLIVSHSLGDILKYCDECIWMERGRIVRHGSALEVVKAYEQFIHILDERRLNAKNYKRITSKYTSDQVDHLSENLVVRFYWKGRSNSWCDISRVKLLKNGQVEEEILVGDTQDTSSEHTGHVLIPGSVWSDPGRDNDMSFRRLIGLGEGDHSGKAVGNVVFYTYAIYHGSAYEVEITYRCFGIGELFVSVWNNNIPLLGDESLPSRSEWSRQTLSLAFPDHPISSQPDNVGKPGDIIPNPTLGDFVERSERRWPSRGALLIEKARIVDLDGKDRAVFSANSQLNLRITVKATRVGDYRVILTAPLFRLDGILVTKFKMDPHPVHLDVDQSITFNLQVDPLIFGNGNYIFSIGLFDGEVEEAFRQDLIDRSFEFQVIGNEEYFQQVVFNCPVRWSYA